MAHGRCVQSAACDPTVDRFGNYPMIRSATSGTRTFTDIASLNASMDGQTVWVRARLHTTRGKGKIAFVVLRQKYSTIQGTVYADGENIKGPDVKFVAGYVLSGLQ